MPKSASNFTGILVVLLVAGILSFSCRRQFIKEGQGDTTGLVGSWEKASASACSAVYPNVIEFSPNGIYQTQSEVTEIQMAWDAGTYEVDRQAVKITNAQDISKTYRFVIKNEMVTFEDEQGCRFPYRRM